MKFQLTILFLAFLAWNAIAGNEGGGGGAVVCRDANKKIITAELLDLFEAPLVYNRTVHRYDWNLNEQFLNNINQAFYYLPFQKHVLLELADEIQSKIRFLPPGIILNKPRDIGENFPEVMQEGCDLEGLGYYTRAGELLVAKPTYEKLSETDKAAFILHEVIYFLYRQYHGWDLTMNPPQQRQLDSIFSRELVGIVFGDQKVWEASDFYKNYIDDNDEIIEVPLLLSVRRPGAENFVIRAYQDREDQDRPNSLEVACTDYSKHVRLSSNKRDYLDKGVYETNVYENNHLCRGLTVMIKYPTLIDKLEIIYNGEVIHTQMKNFNGENKKGLHFNLALKSKLIKD